MESSNSGNKDAKNNLAEIYKNGIDTKKNIPYAIELFQEAIKLKSNISMYNLSHLYFYENIKGVELQIIIELLVKSSHIIASRVLLALVLIKKYKFITLKQILYEFNPYESINNKQKYEYALRIYNFIKNKQLENIYYYEDMKNKCQQIDFMINYNYYPTFVNSLINRYKTKKIQKPKQNNINQDFYDGFEL